MAICAFVAQAALEVLRSISAVSLAGYLQLIVSGVSVVNAIGIRPLTVSAEWIITKGTPNFTYAWSIELPTASATTSSLTRIVSAGSGILRTALISTTASDAVTTNLTSSIFVFVRYAGVPNLFDGKYQESNQPKRRTWPT